MDKKNSARIAPGILARCRGALDCSSNKELAAKLGLSPVYIEELEVNDDADISLLYKRAVLKHGISPTYFLLGIGKKFFNDIQRAEEFFNKNE